MGSILHKLKKKAEGVLEREKGRGGKPLFNKIKVALIYPNLYKIGMSNLGFQHIYYILNNEEDVVCERVFLPDASDISLIKKNHIPLFSLESQTPLEQFDIISFSASFELDYINIANILELAHIPFKASDRRADHPLIIAGGIAPTFNPEPIASFMDAIVIGEGERSVLSLIDIYRNRERYAREEFFEALAHIKGVYIPSAYSFEYNANGIVKAVSHKEGYPSSIKRDYIEICDREPVSSHILTPDTIFSNTFLIEIERGCKSRCKFCVGSHIYAPHRVYRLEEIIKAIDKGRGTADNIGLIGMSLSGYPELKELCRYCIDQGISVSVSSLRIDIADDTLFELLSFSKAKTITFAPEAGSERLRRQINKNISDKAIFDIIERALRYNILNIKLYFLIGLPGEVDEDITGIIDMAVRIKDTMLLIGKDTGKIGTLTLSVNPFIPKPFTPYERSSMDSISSLERKLKMLKKGLSRLRNIKISSESIKLSMIQGLLSIGDRRLGDVIIDAHRLNGDFISAIKNAGIDLDAYIRRDRAEDEILPWGHIEL